MERERAVRDRADHSPSVVLLDLAIPRLSGNELARRIREEGLLPGAVLVATTGRTSVTSEELALESGCDHVVVKPYDLTKILAIVRRSS
ncbi:MAG: response regulator [Myxococcota bacterium]|nr:response regulator [Myxococcota bacterium]